jgi:membrane associated rhomboid family serine protease
MGINDRDYSRNAPSGGFGNFRPYSITTWLIALNVGVFMADGLLMRMNDSEFLYYGGPLTRLGYFSVTLAVFHFQFWRFVTFQFLHSSVGHIFWNMIGLYFFGPIVESYLGGRRYLAFYLSCGAAGALMYILLWACHILVDDPATPLVGASAGIFGIIIAAAKLAPGMTITLWFPPIPVTLRVLAWAYIGIAVYTVITYGRNAGGEASHLGGGLWGYLLISNQHWLNYLTPRSRILPKRRRKAAFRDWTRDPNH